MLDIVERCAVTPSSMNAWARMQSKSTENNEPTGWLKEAPWLKAAFMSLVYVVPDSTLTLGCAATKPEMTIAKMSTAERIEVGNVSSSFMRMEVGL